MEKEKFVLCFITTYEGKRTGMRVYNSSTKKVSEVSLPREGVYLNLTIRGGRMYPKLCKISEFPVIKESKEQTAFYLPSVVGANAWVLGKYGDGRLRLLSLTGQEKTVTNETALGFHNEYKIVGCGITPEGVLIPPTKTYLEYPLETKPTRSKKVNSTSKPTPKSTPKSTPNSTSKPTPKSTTKSTPKSTTKATPKSTTKATTKSTTKATTKSTTKATPKTTPKSTSKTGNKTALEALANKPKGTKSKKTQSKPKLLSPISGKTFCITGKVSFPGLRAGLQAYIISLGGQISLDVTKDVDYLITNDPYSLSAKNKVAHRLGCSIITEDHLLAMTDFTAKAI